MEFTAINIAVAVAMAWIGSMEWRLRHVRSEGEKLIDLKQEGIRVTQKEFSRDINRLEKKMDEIIKLLLSLKRD